MNMFRKILPGAFDPADDEPASMVVDKLTVGEVKKRYERPAQFPGMAIAEYQPDSQTFLLRDGFSVGAVFDVTPIATEGRDEAWLAERRDLVQDAIMTSFPEDPEAPWIVQQYTYDEYFLDDFIWKLRNYPKPGIRETAYTQHWLDVYEEHIRGITKPGGLFNDTVVLDGPWSAKQRRVKLVIYRNLPKGWRSFRSLTPEQELNDVCEKFETSIRESGVRLARNTGRDVYRWLIHWFNPNPRVTGGDRRDFLNLADYPGEEDLPYGDDFSENLFYTPPYSDAEKSTWVLDDMPHRCIRVNKLRRKPRIGQIAGEETASADSKASCMMDRLPEGSVMCLTTIITPQSEIESKLNRLYDKSRGESTEATYARRDIETAREITANKQPIYRVAMAVYVRADNDAELSSRCNDVAGLLLNNNLAPVREEDEAIGLDAWVYNLPFEFDIKMDNRMMATRPAWAQHIAGLSSFFGRHQGTGNPGMTFFNRGGGPLSIDPFNPADRRKNAMGVVLGPTGSGKSATMLTMAAQVMAIHRPRLFIIEVGDSFGLFGDYLESYGLTVNKIQVKPGNPVSLAPFLYAARCLDNGLEDGETPEDDRQLPETLVHRFIPEAIMEAGFAGVMEALGPAEQAEVRRRAELMARTELMMQESDDDEQTDLLGSMEIIAILMITGGEESEAQRMTRADRRMVRDAILNGARLAQSENRRCLTQDVRQGFRQISQDEAYPVERRNRAFEMSESLALFCDGFEGAVFNQDKEPFPEADVTILDLAHFGREGYRAQLAIAYTSIMMSINDLAERNSHQDREILMLTDEAHIVTTNPLLAPFILKVVKMWRKLGAWWWAGTQSVGDFPDSSARLLSMIEFWVALVMAQDEIDEVCRFRQLSDSQRQLMLSARKEPKKYTEGVILSADTEALIRVVPPSLWLSLASTEKSEKVERAEAMRLYGITEVEAAVYIAKMIDYYRGIGEKPEPPIPARVARSQDVA